MRTFEGLLAAVAELEFAALEFDRVVDVVGHAAKGVPVSGHAVTQPQTIAPIQSENNQHDNDDGTLHCFAGYLPLISGATPARTEAGGPPTG